MGEHREQVGLRELRHDARAVIDRLATSGPIDITDRGRVIAQLSPAPATDLARRAPRVARALDLLSQHPAVDSGSYRELFADKQADIDLAEADRPAP